MLTVLLLSMSCFATCSDQDAWWYDQGHDWDTSDHFNSYNPFYQTFKQVKAQLDMYGYAKHIGKINRGQFFNPELTRPGDRAYGYKHDFNPNDINSGAFRYKPMGQRFRAKPVHVNAGLAGKVGEIATMPIGQFVQNDGSVLMQTSKKQSNPCSPNPCTNNNFPMCEEVLDGTAKCSRSETYTMTLTWEDHVADDLKRNELDITIVSVKHDGTPCYYDNDHTHEDRHKPGSYSGHTNHLYAWGVEKLIHDDHSECGVNMEQPYQEAYDDNGDATIGKNVAIFETLQDGTNWEDYTHQIIVVEDIYSIKGFPVLSITDENGEVVQELQIPQYDGVVEVNPISPDNIPPNLDPSTVPPIPKYLFFFGCFRHGFVDTTGAGFYVIQDHVLDTGLPLFDAGLCNALY